MSMTGRWAEALSEALGKGGAITAWVTQIDQILRHLCKMSMIVISPSDCPIAIITAPGDPAAGIPEHQVRVTGLTHLGNPEQRDWIRGVLREAFVSVMDDALVGVRFSDECEECGQPVTVKLMPTPRGRTVDCAIICSNGDCINNAPED